MGTPFTAVFWNTGRQPIGELLGELAARETPDLVVLGEVDPSADPKNTKINGYSEALTPTSSAESKLRLFAKGGIEVDPVFDDASGRLTIRRVLVPGEEEILVGAVHLPSKLYWSNASQAQESAMLAKDIADTEDQQGHQRTLVIGDFNMNPFEDGMISAAAFHAVMSLEIALKGSRTVSGRQYRFFYNPMWSLYGDRPEGPPGTHYYARPTHTEHFWHMFDQVLLRPSLARSVTRVAVLDSIGPAPLTDKNSQPDDKIGSDHLPILVSLDLGS